MDPQELHNMLGALVSKCPALEKVCDTWGNQHMLTIAMEENAELIQAISKIKRYGVDPINASHLNEEVADVLICIYELYVMGYLVTDKIAKIIKSKVGRSMKRTQDYIKDLEDKCKSYEKANKTVLSIYNEDLKKMEDLLVAVLIVISVIAIAVFVIVSVVVNGVEEDKENNNL